MSETKIERLADICEIVVGRTPSRNDPSFWGQGHPWLSIADMNQGLLITKTKEEITDLGAAKGKLVPAGTVLLSFKLSIGKVSIAGMPLYTNEAIAALVIKDPQKIDSRYLMWTLKSMDLATGSNRAAMGATLNKAKLQDIRIPIPPLDEQIRKVQIEDIQYAITQKRERQQDLLQELEESVFTRLFIKKSYISKPLSDLANIWDCPHSTPKWTNSGNICLRTTNLGYGDWKWADIRYIDDEQFKKRSRGGGTKPGDIIISREGTVGVAAIVPNGLEVAMGQRLVQIRCKDSNVIPEFLLGYLLYSLAPEKISAKMVGSTAKHLNVKDLKNLPTPIPLLEDQILYKKLRELISHMKI